MNKHYHFQFTVYGSPKPQGSKKVVPIMKAGGIPVIKNGRVLTRAVNDNPKLGEWRQEVAQAGRKAFVEVTQSDDPDLLTEPVSVEMTFVRPRPLSHYGTGRNAGTLKASATQYPTPRPDTLKLARAVEDAITGVILADDSQIVTHELKKRWGKCFMVEVDICSMSNEVKDLNREENCRG